MNLEVIQLAKVVYVKQSNVSPYSKTVTLLLCLFLGGFGAHRFYVGKNGTAVLLLLLTLCGFGGIWAIIDLILILTDGFTDNMGRAVSSWDGGQPAPVAHAVPPPGTARPAQPPQKASAPPPPQRKADEMFCNTCGALVKRTETYCHYCGAVLQK